MWMIGTACYGICVFVSNLILLIQTHNFTKYGEILIVMSMVAFFLILLIESKWNWSLFAPVNHMFSNMLAVPSIWFSMFLTTATICLIEGGKQAYFKVWKIPLTEEVPNENKYSIDSRAYSSQVNSSHSKTSQLNKIVKQKTFAFDQDPKAGSVVLD